VTVVAYGDFVDGTGEQLVVETLLDGTVLINPPDPMASPPPAVETVTPLATGECDDNYTDGNIRDFPSGHPNLTMGGANAQCPDPDQKRTLGLGDMLSLESVY